MTETASQTVTDRASQTVTDIKERPSQTITDRKKRPSQTVTDTIVTVTFLLQNAMSIVSKIEADIE